MSWVKGLPTWQSISDGQRNHKFHMGEGHLNLQH